jgi:hypothetical protein
MKVTCPISGIVTSQTVPVRGHVIHPHAMLSSNIKCAQLADWYLESWAKGDLPETETHLLGCAYLLKLPIESIGLAPMDAIKLAQWDKFWSSNMEKLARLASKLEGKNSAFKYLPRLVVTQETIAVLPEWIKDLETELSVRSESISDKAKELNRASYKLNTENANNPSKYLAEDQIDQVVRRALNGSILTNNEAKALPVILSDWALKVTEFPDATKMRWQRIVQLIFDADYINKILMSDIKLDQVKALEQHLLCNTPAHAVGTSHSSILMARLAMVIPVFEDFSPEISYRKKGNQDDLLAALDGNSDVPQQRASAASGTSVSSHKEPKLTLAQRLAARLSNMGAK